MKVNKQTGITAVVMRTLYWTVDVKRELKFSLYKLIYVQLSTTVMSYAVGRDLKKERSIFGPIMNPPCLLALTNLAGILRTEPGVVPSHTKLQLCSFVFIF